MDDHNLQLLLYTNALEQKRQNIDSSSIHKLHLCIYRLAMRRSGLMRSVGCYIRVLETSNRVIIYGEFLWEFQQVVDGVTLILYLMNWR
jgi:hypothetical protein